MPTKSVPSSKQKTTAIKKSKTKKFQIGIISPLQSQNKNLLLRGLEGFCELGFESKILAEGDAQAQKKCLELLGSHPESFSVHESILSEKENIIKASDIVIFEEAPSQNELNFVIKNGTPCVIPMGCGLQNFDPQNEIGEAFTFEPENFWSFMSAVIRASENKKFAYDWRILKRNLGKI